MSFEISMDPGETNLGLNIADLVTKLCDHYLCDLRPLETVKVKRKRTVKATKTRPKHVVEYEVEKRQAVTLKYLPELIEMFIQALDPWFSKATIFEIEEQKISAKRPTAIAMLLYQTARWKYPNLIVTFVDPKTYRAKWGITVNKKDYPGLNKQELRLVRKAKSYEETNLIPADRWPEFMATFSIPNHKGVLEFHPDALEAGLMLAYGVKHREDVLANRTTTLPYTFNFLTRSVKGIPLILPPDTLPTKKRKAATTTKEPAKKKRKTTTPKTKKTTKAKKPRATKSK
jgi:hypothetical protein